MKYVRLFVLVSMIFVALFFAFSNITYAKTANYRTINVSIVRNTQTRHFYFVPTYVPCLTGPTRIRIVNQTESVPVVQLENYVRVVVQPYSSLVETEYIGRNSHWVLLEPNYLGGNAYLFFRRCGFGYALPRGIRYTGPIPQPGLPSGPPIYQPQPPVYNPYHRTGAICNDGTFSPAIGRGACAFHQGVNHWL